MAELMLESHSKQKGNTIKGREESTQTACGVTQDAQNQNVKWVSGNKASDRCFA